MQGPEKGREGRNRVEVSPVGLLGQAVGTVLPKLGCLPASWLPRTGAGGSPLASGCPQLQRARKRRGKAR